MPWTKSCFVCGESNPRGLRLKSHLADGRVMLEYTTRESDLGWKHTIHGGLTMTLLDEVMTWAAMIASAKPCVAAEVSVRLVAPVEPGEKLTVVSPVPERARKVIQTNAEVRNSAGEIVARASGKYLPMREHQFELSQADFVTGPGSLNPDDILG